LPLLPFLPLLSFLPLFVVPPVVQLPPRLASDRPQHAALHDVARPEDALA
jgi:hypothetical protein